MSDLPTFVFDRRFQAPRDQVWQALTQAEHLAHWYGPNVTTIVHKLDVRPGGVWLNEMQMGGGSGFERMDYIEVEPKSRLVWHHAVTDSEWQIIANPHMPDWPRVLLTVIVLTGDENNTDLRLTWTPYNASSAEIACFSKSMEGLKHGWNKGMDLLQDLLT